jgi:N-acetylglutamate synthase-like GNAT family acetyltransferase
MKARIRRATDADTPAVADLIHAMGYPGSHETIGGTLSRLGEASTCPAVVAEYEGVVVGLLVLCCRPSLTLQGWIGTVSELVVAPAHRRSEIGEALLHYAKGLAVERGLVRLECSVPGGHDVATGRFLLERGFEEADATVYRWSVLESKHPRLPAAPGRERAVPA